MKHSLHKNKKQILETIKLVEDRIDNVKNKITTIEKQINTLEREIGRINLGEPQKKKHELEIIELNNSLDILNDGKNELINILKIKNEELKIINQRIQDIERHGEINPFDFSDNPKDDDIDVNKFLTLAEKNVILFENDFFSKL